MARILKFDDRSWHNWHFTERDVPIAGRYELHRAVTASLSDMRASAKALQDLIGKAFTDRRRLRAHGATWSFSAAPSVPGGWPLATGYANQLFALPKTHVDPTFSGDHDGLVLCQTGISVAELNMWLEPRGRSLATSGASNGQTFVGAMSCSTHGSAIDHGAIQSQVRAIQLIPGPDRDLWIEPASRPVTDGRLAGELGAAVVRDDRLFAAALVSLGALGVVHAVLIESVPRFLLENHRRRVAAGPELLRAMASLGDTDFAACNLPGAGGRRPYFFQSVINDHIDKGFAYVTCGYRRDWDSGHNLDYSINPKRSPGYNLATVVANLLDAAPGLTPVITKAVLADQLSPINGRVGSWGQSFNFTTPRAGTAGASVAAPADRVHDVLAIYHAALKKVGKAPVAFACRYARQSPGNLTFIRWPQSVIADIDGLDNGAARQVMAQAIADLRNARIPHTEHWGKLNQATASSVRDAYGDDLERWLAARVDLLACELRLLHQQNPPLKAASILPDSSHSNRIHFAGQGQVECWADDVPDGKQTDFRRAVQAVADEEIVFSWVEWPDKATRDAALEKMKGWMANPESADPRMDPTANPMPFDGKRVIFGGFRPVVELVGR